ncbi:DUF4334 domain-containing protein [Commensalibacter papalotli (ex Servin-Garciduenas et al. 2014)]|uniref:DUF4334 domain-containing protein n=1 Tax=Commensalibacter papalotli (ex Servin-Garciduenas et al. 2014) TaxID=1208583 RepID=W7DVS6_9PROT|nr:DUF4334 domain-containing protein [Commensalibacter papalotli (ex Servin-Garciduenas et al. 2014)]EUK19130.1 hypothetical protein COMX_05250 [Commensalibacter papalotli (ex Servin-Garciduenas et al. 2014)]
MTKTQEFTELLSQDHSRNDEQLFNFFDSLLPLTIDDMISKWKGEDINTGHWVSKELVNMNWYGKWYKNQLEAIPLVCFNQQGKLFSEQKFKGEASLWMVEYRGVTTATMVYDGVPIFDHFKKISDNHVLGVMNGKNTSGLPEIIQNGRYYFFHMKRVSNYPTDFIS